MRTAGPALVLLLAFSTAGAAPAPDPGREAVKELEKLKKRMPDIVAAWMKKEGASFVAPLPGSSYTPELRLLRRISPDRAKGVILLAAIAATGKRNEECDEILSVFLSYQDGCWTTERIETVAHRLDHWQHRLFLARLMLAIDEASEK
jgi:hypothetical protein